MKLLCEIAAERSLLVDMHCDESDDPLSRHIETLAFEAQRLGLHVAQMTSQKGIRQGFNAVTTNAAKVMHLQGYGLEVGWRWAATRVLCCCRRGMRLRQFGCWRIG